MKLFLVIVCMIVRESPPSRGAWIEIPRLVSRAAIVTVAPLAGGVD